MIMDANALIEKVEREMGCRIDDNDGDNNAMTALFGAIAKALQGQPYGTETDFAAGIVVQHQLSDEYRRQKEADAMLSRMLVAGISPDDVRKLMG